MDYKDTLLMPQTEFQMRGNLGVREVEFQKRWEDIRLYEKVLEKNKAGKPFILHDGPPYANGNIHIGHAFQKTLKDFVLRYKTMQGFYTPYIPGWDTHGLPIENEVTKKGINRKEMNRADFLKVCEDFALEQVNKQKEQFKRLGILGDWDHPYLTLDKTFVADQIRLFAKMTARGLIYRGLKPVYWSPSSESALAEAEIEYQDKESFSIYVAFEVVSEGAFKGNQLIIWTTTPWTLPGNLAVSVHPDKTYAQIVSKGKTYIVLHDLADSIVQTLGLEDFKVIRTFKGKELEFVMYAHPLFDRVSPIILGEHVTDTDGTGLVHTAPGYGEDDYQVGKKYQLDILAPIDDKGVLTEEAGPFAGLFYEKANEVIVEALKEKQALLKVSKINHSYPHDWRTHKPVIFRATPQWFFNVESIKKELMGAIRTIEWIPSWGEVRLANMMETRSDWVISRQRAWGVPIPVFYDENKTPILDEKLMLHVADIFEEKGSNYWYEADVKDLLPASYSNKNLTKEMDIMDVWFDSGTSYSVLERRGLNFPADLYLEGSDQYRGWFNSSLITSIATHDKSPYKRVVSHGFVLDGQGRKMSKSLGNVIDPLSVMKQNGADILRLWVASVTYQSDVRISNDMMVQIAEGYRKIRNTLRYMIGNLFDYQPETDYVGFSMRGNVNQMMTIRYEMMKKQVLDAYEAYEFDKVYRSILPFMINELSAFYLDYTKDILYIEGKKSFNRLSVQSTLYDMLMGLLKLLTPIIPHTTSEAYQTLPFAHLEDVYLESMPDDYIHDMKHLMDMYDTMQDVRGEVLKQLELAREQKVIGKSLQASVHIEAPKHVIEVLESLHVPLHQLFMASSITLKVADHIKADVVKAEGVMCDRCWNIVETTNTHGVCKRCEASLKEDGYEYSVSE